MERVEISNILVEFGILWDKIGIINDVSQKWVELQMEQKTQNSNQDGVRTLSLMIVTGLNILEATYPDFDRTRFGKQMEGMTLVMGKTGGFDNKFFDRIHMERACISYSQCTFPNEKHLQKQNEKKRPIDQHVSPALGHIGCEPFIEYELEQFSRKLKVDNLKNCTEQINQRMKRREMFCSDSNTTCWIQPETRYEGDPDFICIKNSFEEGIISMILILLFIILYQ